MQDGEMALRRAQYILFSLFAFLLLSTANAKPLSKDLCDVFFPTPAFQREVFSSYPAYAALPEFRALAKRYLELYGPIYKKKRSLCASGDSGDKLKQRQGIIQIHSQMMSLNEPYAKRDMAKTKQEIERVRRKIAEWDPKYRKSTDNIASSSGSSNCEFSACTFGKAKCCAMARAQLKECRAADSANANLYSQYGEEGAASSRSIKECVRCSQVWLRQNGC